MKNNEAEKGKSSLPGGRKIIWKKKMKDIDLTYFVPIFGQGLREKQEPQQFLAEAGMKDFITKLSVKELSK